MKSLKIEAEFCGEVSVITFKDESDNVLYKSEQSGDFIQNTFAKIKYKSAMHHCAESLREIANVILGEKE